MTKKLDYSLGGVNKVFREQQEAAGSKRIVSIPLDQLHQHPQLNVSVQDDAYLKELTESIKKNGILEEIRAFPDPDGGYWIISGRHRAAAAKLAGFEEVDCILDDDMTQETAEIAITDSNLRHDLSVMEKAWTYRIKRDAESRQGYRSDLHGKREKDKTEESERTITRYIRLTYLIPALAERTELQGKYQLKIRTGEALSFLSEELQREVEHCICQSGKLPDQKTAEEWKKLCETLSKDDIARWFYEIKPTKVSASISIHVSDLAGVIPAGYGKKQIAELVHNLLTEWARKNEVVSEDPFPNLKIGECVESHGALLKWEDLRIGMKMIRDFSTGSHEWFRITQVEEFTTLENGERRVILRDGFKSRSYINRSHVEQGSVRLYRPVDEGNPEVEALLHGRKS